MGIAFTQQIQHEVVAGYAHPRFDDLGGHGKPIGSERVIVERFGPVMEDRCRSTPGAEAQREGESARELSIELRIAMSELRTAIGDFSPLLMR